MLQSTLSQIYKIKIQSKLKNPLKDIKEEQGESGRSEFKKEDN